MAIMSRTNGTCQVCSGRGTIGDFTCMVCDGTLPFPRVSLTSNSVPRAILDQYQDYYQLQILSEYAPYSAVDPGKFMIPSDILLDEILTCFVLDKTKEKISSMFS